MMTKRISAVSRRGFIAGAAGLLTLPGLSRAAAARLDELVLFGPPAGPSIVLAAALAQGHLAPLARSVRLKIWTNPDEMRAGLVSGTMPLAVMPTTAAAALYNRGFPIRLLNTMTDGLLYIVSADPALQAVPDLKGKVLAIPFGNDLPNFILSRVLTHHGLDEARDLSIMITGTPTEAIQLLLTGHVAAALVPDPSAAAAEIKSKALGKVVERRIDLQVEWGKITGLGSFLPQAGVGVTEAFLSQYPETVAALSTLLIAAADAVRADPATAAAAAAPTLDLPVLVLTAAIPHCNLVTRPAHSARSALDASFRAILAVNPGGIGGKLPDDRFYL